MVITYIQDTITIKEERDGKIAERQVEATVADAVGLAYRIEKGETDTDVAITITHVGSGACIGGSWQVSTREEAQRWIEALDEIVDWTGEYPRVRSGMHGKVLDLVAIGALHEL